MNYWTSWYSWILFENHHPLFSTTGNKLFSTVADACLHDISLYTTSYFFFGKNADLYDRKYFNMTISVLQIIKCKYCNNFTLNILYIYDTMEDTWLKAIGLNLMVIGTGKAFEETYLKNPTLLRESLVFCLFPKVMRLLSCIEKLPLTYLVYYFIFRFFNQLLFDLMPHIEAEHLELSPP